MNAARPFLFRDRTMPDNIAGSGPSRPFERPSLPEGWAAVQGETTRQPSQPFPRFDHGASPEEAASTNRAPSCPPPLEASSWSSAQTTTDTLAPGERIDDFEIRGVLGRGAFGVVYLARQLSLDRQVALKVSAGEANEGRSLAQLEHGHIVQIFSETMDRSGKQRLLCMQYVPGPTLQTALRELHAQSQETWSGAALLAVVDRLTPHPASFDPAAIRNRDVLGDSDWVETVCWIGARLAEALDYAHTHGVIHRDIKPGNIMLSQYGRPMLVDFSLAFRPLAPGTEGEDRLGGTVLYMAPEHLDAMSGEADAPPSIVAEPADIYSLGVVLYEMLTGKLPFPRVSGGGARGTLAEMAAQRRQTPPALPPNCPLVLDQLLARCLHPDRGQRFGSAAELAAALEGGRQFHAAAKTAPPEGRWIRAAEAHPLLGLLLVALAPHVVGTILNIAYNQIRIISHLTEAQETVFVRLIFGYDTVAYALGIAWGMRVLLPVYRVWPMALSRQPADGQRIRSARLTALSWPLWAIGLACLGWLPGGFIFPLGLALFAGPLPWRGVFHLLVSFTISGLIALTYSTLFVQWMVLSVFYPRLWRDTRDFRAQAAVELRPVMPRLRLLQVFSGVIPLVGAVLMMGAGPQEFTAQEYVSFRFLVTALIVLGMAGFQLAMLITGRLSQRLDALTGPHL